MYQTYLISWFQIRKLIFQGIIIGLQGAIVGSIIGILICYIQDHFGIISINMSSSIIENYPVKIIYKDIFLVGLIVTFISAFSSIIPAIYASKYKNFLELNQKWNET